MRKGDTHEDGRTICTRESILGGTVTFPDADEPGRYFVVVSLDGREVHRTPEKFRAVGDRIKLVLPKELVVS